MKPVLKIDGVDFAWILNEGGISWSRNDLDSEKTGRLLNGDLYRKRVAVKRKLRISNCKRMTTAEINKLNKALYPELITVEFLDPIVGGYYKGVFYGASVEATTQIYDDTDDETYWEDTSFSLTER